MKKFWHDILKDTKTDKWSLGRIFAFAFLCQLFILSFITIVVERKIPDIPSNYLMLLLILLGYNAVTKVVNGHKREDQ